MVMLLVCFHQVGLLLEKPEAQLYNVLDQQTSQQNTRMKDLRANEGIHPLLVALHDSLSYRLCQTGTVHISMNRS